LTEGNEAGETRQKIAEIAGTSTGTIRKVKKLAEAADEETSEASPWRRFHNKPIPR
jgi:hypothetical protein